MSKMDIQRYDILQKLFESQALENISERVAAIIATARRRADAAKIILETHPPAAKKSRADPPAGSGSTGGGGGSGSSGSEVVAKQGTPWLPSLPANRPSPLPPTVVAPAVMMQSGRARRVRDMIKINPLSEDTDDSMNRMCAHPH